MLAFLIFLHWFPEILTGLYGETLVLNARRYKFILVVGHALTMIGITTRLVGPQWTTWQNLRKAHLNLVESNLRIACT